MNQRRRVCLQWGLANLVFGRHGYATYGLPLHMHVLCYTEGYGQGSVYFHDSLSFAVYFVKLICAYFFLTAPQTEYYIFISICQPTALLLRLSNQ